MTEAIPKVAPNRPVKMGRRYSGTVCIMTIMLPEKMPADPRPTIDLPMMNATEVGAEPYIAEPNSNIPMQLRKTHLVE